jgi:hypothetical protein
MRESDKDNGIELSCSQKLTIALIIIAMALVGCTRHDQKPDPVVEPVVMKDEINLGKPAISPSVVSVGASLRQELKYSVFAKKMGKLKVSEVIVVSGKALKMELSRKESEIEQGEHVSTFQFKVPKGLPTGDYQLITTIAFGRENKNTTGSFRVKR